MRYTPVRRQGPDSAATSFFSAIRRTLSDGIVPGQAPSIRPIALFMYFFAFAAVLLVVMLAYNQFFKTPMGDQLYWQAISKYHLRFGHWYSFLNADPMQGMFDVFPQGYRGNLIFWLFYSQPWDLNWIYASIYALFAFLMAASTYILGRSAGMGSGAAMLASVALPIFTIPFLLSWNGVVTHIYALTINYAYVQSAVLLALALFLRIDGKSKAKFAFSVLAGFLLLADASNTMALHITLFAPAVVVFGVGGLCASSSRIELRAKILWAVLVSAGLIALGIPNYLQALGSDLAYRFFFDELNDFSQPWTPQFQHFLNDFYYVISWSGNPTGAAAAVASTLGIASAIYYSVLGGHGKFRIFARSFLVLIGLTGVAVFVLHFPVAFFGYMYKGPNAYHLVYVFWPFHAMMIARALIDGLLVLSRKITESKTGRVEGSMVHGLVVVTLLLPLTQLSPLLRQSGWEVSAGELDVSIRHVPMTEFLSREIGIAPGATFRGTYNNFVGLETNRKNRRNLVFDISLVGRELSRRVGSDLTKHGLWVLGIPTFAQESVTITSQLYLMVSELLTLPDDKQIRSFLIPTQPVGPILELWGVRFILIDENLPFGTLVMTEAADKYTSGAEAPEPARFKLPLNLYELERANRGDYSPTSVERAQDARGVIARMREPEFDGRKHVIVTEELAGDFVPAENARMTVREGGFDLTANSEAESLLVLPVQYSHCWEISGQGDASLFRANFLQLGIRFRGDLNVELRQRFGPLWNSACRLANADDMERLRIEEARQ